MSLSGLCDGSGSVCCGGECGASVVGVCKPTVVSENEKHGDDDEMGEVEEEEHVCVVWGR